MTHQNGWFRTALLQLIADGLGVSLQCHSISRRPILPMSRQIKTHRLVTDTLKLLGTSVPAPTSVRSTMHQNKDSHHIQVFFKSLMGFDWRRLGRVSANSIDPQGHRSQAITTSAKPFRSNFSLAWLSDAAQLQAESHCSDTLR